MAEDNVTAPRGFYKVGRLWWIQRYIHKKRIRVSTRCENLEDAIRWVDSRPELQRIPKKRPLLAASPFHGEPYKFTKKWVSETVSRCKYRKRSDSSLTATGLRLIIERSEGYCEVTGIPFTSSKIDGATRYPFIPSIDRIDSAKPYSLNNCRLVCLCVNIALNQWGDSVFNIMCLARCTKRLSMLGHK